MTHFKDITNNISEASNRTIQWWHTAGMQFGEGILITSTLAYLTISICYYQPMSNGTLWTSQHRSHTLVKIPRIATIPLIGTKYTSFQPLFIAVISVTSQIHHALWTEEAFTKLINSFQYITDQKYSLLLR
jgi:hypothetical protein